VNRRNFASAAAGALAATQAAPAAAQKAKRPVAMYLGCQRSAYANAATSPEWLQYFKRHAVNHICGFVPFPEERGYWNLDEVSRTKEVCEEHGVKLDMVRLPLPGGTHVDKGGRVAIALGQSPERDREIDHVQKMIEACGRAGVPSVKYHISILGVLRTGTAPVRGGAHGTAWRLKDAKPQNPLTRAGVVGADECWERIAYFLERVVPVASEYKVRMAHHPHDPGLPPEGYQGVARVLGTPEGLYKFIALKENPYHGLNLCLGTVAEMLQNPNREIHEVIRKVGKAGKIFNIHFRNIKGRRDDFHETYPDEGDMNMVEVARTLQEVGYQYMVMPDHMPHHEDDPGTKQGFAFGYGYIKALLQCLETLG